MNIETKTVNAYSHSNYEGGKDEYLNFGWTHTEDTQVHYGRGYHKAYVLARDKDMPNYATLSALEGKYFGLKRTKKIYTPMEGTTVALCFLFLIIPGILYVSLKLRQKSKINEHNYAVQKKMDAVVAEAKAYL